MKANNNQKFKYNIKIKHLLLYWSSYLYVSQHLLLHLMWNYKPQLTH